MALHVQCPKCSQKLAVNTPPPPPPPRHKWIAGGVLIGFAIALPAFLILAELMKGDAIRSLEDQVRAANVKASDALDAQLQAEADSRRDLALLRDSNEALKQEAATSEERRKLLVGILDDINDPRCFASVVKVDRAFHPFGRIQLQILGTIDTNPRPIFKFHLLDLLFHVFKRCCGLTDLIAAKVDLLLNGFPLIISNSCYYSSECDHHPAWPAKLHNRAQQRSDEDDSQSIEPFLSLVAKMLAIFLGGKLALEAAYKALQKTNWQIGQRVIACLGCFAVFFAIAFQIVVSIKW